MAKKTTRVQATQEVKKKISQAFKEHGYVEIKSVTIGDIRSKAASKEPKVESAADFMQTTSLEECRGRTFEIPPMAEFAQKIAAGLPDLWGKEWDKTLQPLHQDPIFKLAEDAIIARVRKYFTLTMRETLAIRGITMTLTARSSFIKSHSNPMRREDLYDGVAMCDTVSLSEQQFSHDFIISKEERVVFYANQLADKLVEGIVEKAHAHEKAEHRFKSFWERAKFLFTGKL